MNIPHGYREILPGEMVTPEAMYPISETAWTPVTTHGYECDDEILIINFEHDPKVEALREMYRSDIKLAED